MKVYAIRTSICCPEQYHGVTDGGYFVYVRYRHRRLTVKTSDGSSDIYTTKPIIDITFEKEIDVVEELKKRGIELVVVGTGSHPPTLKSKSAEWTSDKIIIELDYIEWLYLLGVLTEVSRYRGTGTAHMAQHLLNVIEDRVRKG